MRAVLVVAVLAIALTSVVYLERRSSVRSDSIADVIVLVTGTPGVRFTGAIMTIGQGQSRTESVDGVTPARYPARGAIISASFQKQMPGDDVLSILIERDGKTIANASTQASYGVVAVSTPRPK